MEETIQKTIIIHQYGWDTKPNIKTFSEFYLIIKCIFLNVYYIFNIPVGACESIFRCNLLWQGHKDIKGEIFIPIQTVNYRTETCYLID